MPVRILIIENNKAVAQDLASRLGRFGYEVAGICTSGSKAMQTIKELEPDLIVMNTRLQKGMDGIQTGKLVRAKHNIPIVYMAQVAGQSTIQQSKSAGPFGYLFLPFSDKQIFTTLEIALLRNRYEKEIQRQAERAQMLVLSAEQFNSNLDFKTVLNTICVLTHRTLKASATGMFLLNAQKDTYSQVEFISKVVSLQKYKELHFELPISFVNSFLSTKKQILVVEDIKRVKRDLPYAQMIRDENIQSVVIVGVFHQKVLLGVLVSSFIKPPKSLQNADLDLLRGLADQAAIAITNANLFKQVQIGREYQRKLAKSIVNVQEEERRHIARELHDHLGQVLTGLQFMLENTKNQTGDKQRTGIEEIQKAIGEVIGQVREMSLNLRPSMLDDMGLLPTLQWHVERFELQTGIHVNFKGYNHEGRFPQEIETAAYRIVQEALTNVARYAKVKEVFVGLLVQEETLWIEILDQGAGFHQSVDTNKPTSGLSGMRERASLVGGYIIIESFINQGTQIVAALPLTNKPLERRKIERNHGRAGR
ncbi:MAG: response regulator [Anaerolineales bacterium]|nr:response regulator [Anaerolineales bacterium]